jgi:hypothetical protein
MMRSVCAYCGRDMGEKMGPDGMVSHGCCEACLKKELAKIHEVDPTIPMNERPKWGIGARHSDGLD